MHGHRRRIHLIHMMLAVGVVALLLATLRFARDSAPHVRRCWELVAEEERLGQVCRSAALDYRACALTVPISPGKRYCNNACLGHPARQSSDEDRARVAAVHRQAAEDYERAAAHHAAMARLYRRAAFSWSRSLPQASPDGGFWTMYYRYRCDMF